jgi:hypothetical protein
MWLRTIASAIAVAGLVTILATESSVAQGEKDKLVVRSLKFMPSDPSVSFFIGGMSKVTVCTDAAAVEKLVGRDSAKQLLNAFNFENESIVLVSWTTSGPPDGALKHEVKGEGKDRKVTFYVQGPPAGGARGQRARIGADFFAVPKGTAVTFDPKER